MWIGHSWSDYNVIDASSGEKLEKWANFLLVRPDPQVIWNTPRTHIGWTENNGHYVRSATGGGHWDALRVPDVWTVSYTLGDEKKLIFNLKPMSFKHTGLFPEQSVNWEFAYEKIAARRDVKVLNLFAYTGGATLACAAAGAQVCHVDASKGMVGWAKENAALSSLGDSPVRYIVDDCKKFVEREIRRGSKYDAVIMDPPSYGRGPNGEIWKLEDCIYELVELCVQLLSDKPLFFLINSYTTGLSASVMSYILGSVLQSKHGGAVDADEIGLPVSDSGLALPCGCSARWYS